MPMRPYTERDFDDMARRVVDKFASGQAKLADGAVEEAMGGQLNPDQIERLVQAANTMAFLRMMEEREQGRGGGMLDLTGEFDPADTRGVIEQILHQTPSMGGGPEMPHEEPGGEEWSELGAGEHPEHEAVCLDSPGDVPHKMTGQDMDRPGPGPGVGDEHGRSTNGGGSRGNRSEHKNPAIDADNDGPFPKGPKQKAKDDAEKKEKKPPAKAPEKDEKLASVVRDRRYRKLASALEDQLLQAELAFDDGYARLGQALKVAHGAPQLEALEKDAVALDSGPYTVAVINLLREERGMEPMTQTSAHAKHAALQDRYIVSDYPALRELEALVKIAAEADKLRRGAEYVRSQCD